MNPNYIKGHCYAFRHSGYLNLLKQLLQSLPGQLYEHKETKLSPEVQQHRNRELMGIIRKPSPAYLQQSTHIRTPGPDLSPLFTAALQCKSRYSTLLFKLRER